jgi:glutathione synthase/RimK-type ligase-like ATP-grasp enzyme
MSAEHEKVEDAMQCWAEITPAFVINRPSTMGSNSSKPYQLDLIRSLGFEIPETLITTVPDAALEFWSKHRDVIYKSISGVRSVVSRVGPEHSDRLADVANCPTQFQRYIKGTDYRVHVVGNEVFAAEIISRADDYRYARRSGFDIEIRAKTLPPDVADRCRVLSKSLCMAVAGVDLRLTPDGKWYCFEVNPSPAFTFYADETDQPIGAAIARLLVHPPALRPAGFSFAKNRAGA